MHHHVTRSLRPPRLLTTAAALAAATTIAACGSGSPDSPNSRASRATSPVSSTSSTLAFSKCMRADGVPNLPDLSSTGMLIQGSGQTMSVNGVSVNAPAFLAARAKCRKYLPTPNASTSEQAQQRARGLKFAQCMRSHGVPNFPDPKVTTGPGGNQEAYLPGINPQSPAFQAAAKDCGGGPKGPL
jgi:hypothetical protein